MTMRRIIITLTACLVLGMLAGCAAEGGDPTEAVPKDVFQVVYVPSVGLLWDGAAQVIAALRQVEPRMAEEFVQRIEELVRRLFRSDEPPVESLQELWDAGVDVERPLVIAVGGFPVPQPVVLLSIHDPSSFYDFYYESIGEDMPEPIETYAEVEVRLTRGVYSVQTGGLFIASASFGLLKGCVDALGDPEERFFELEGVRPLRSRFEGCSAALLIDLSSVKGLMTLALTQAPDVPGFVKDWMTRVQSAGLGLTIQPEGVRLTACAYGDFTGVEERETEPPVPRDCLAYVGGDRGDVSLEEKRELAGLLVQLLSMHPKSAELVEVVGEENLISLVLSLGTESFLFVHDSGWMPGVTFGFELEDPALFRLIYDSKLRPLLEEVLAEELSDARLERRVEGEVEMDVLTLEGLLMLPVKPAAAFYDDYLILTTDAGIVGKMRDVDLGRAEGVGANEDYCLVEGQLPGYRVRGFASADKLLELLAMTPGLELPEVAQLLGGHYGLVSVGSALADDVVEGVLLVSTRTYTPDGWVPRSEIQQGPPWWLWLVIGLGAVIVVILIVVLTGRRRREV
jgi:hypothetical protein